MIAAGASDDAVVRSATASYCGARASTNCAEEVKGYYASFQCAGLGDAKKKDECQTKFKNALKALKEVENGWPKDEKKRLYLEAQRLSGGADPKKIKVAVDEALTKVGKDLPADFFARTHVLAVKPGGSVQLSNLQLKGGGELLGVALYATKPYLDSAEDTPGITGYLANVSGHADILFSRFKLVSTLGLLGGSFPNNQSILGINAGDYTFNSYGAEGGMPTVARVDAASVVASGTFPLGERQNWILNFDVGAGLVISARMLDGSGNAFNNNADQVFGVPNNSVGSTRMRGILLGASLTYKNPITLTDVVAIRTAFLYGSAKVALGTGLSASEGSRTSKSLSVAITPASDPVKIGSSIGHQSADGDAMSPAGCDITDAAHCKVDIAGAYKGDSTYFSASVSRPFTLLRQSLLPSVGYRFDRTSTAASPVPYSEHMLTAGVDFIKLAGSPVDLILKLDYVRRAFDSRQVTGGSGVVISGTGAPSGSWDTGAEVLASVFAVKVPITEVLNVYGGWQFINATALLTGKSSNSNEVFVATTGKF